MEEGAANAQGIPISMFSLEIKTADEQISGAYCYISNYGNKEQCHQAFSGKKTAQNLYQIQFKDDAGMRGAVAELSWVQHQSNRKQNQWPNQWGDQLLWKLIKLPEHSEFSMPKFAHLIKEKPESKRNINQRKT